MTLFLTLVLGFSVLSCGLLYTVYAGFLYNVNRSPRALICGGLLLFGLAMMQLGHLQHLDTKANLLHELSYRLWLFATPSMFYLFSRSILFDESRFDWKTAAHLTPLLLLLIPKLEVAVSLLFCVGAGYSLWLTQLIYHLHGTRERGRIELFFLVIFSLLAVGVLALVLALPYIDPGLFFRFYALVIGGSLMLVVGALLAYPELLGELAQAAKLSYASSTLGEIDVPSKREELDRLMTQDQIYRQEDLSLASLSDTIGLAPHQLSELLNVHYKMSFSSFVREHRIREAQRLLRTEPKASILSIGMEVGFKSQSNFYAAFKAFSGQSPGSYRDQSANQ